jgi:hypothetical protein
MESATNQTQPQTKQKANNAWKKLKKFFIEKSPTVFDQAVEYGLFQTTKTGKLNFHSF